jgi:hypothetical protein
MMGCLTPLFFSSTQKEKDKATHIAHLQSLIFYCHTIPKSQGA